VQTTDPVVAALNEEFSAAGFVRRKKSWYLQAAEVTVLAELQPSQWDGGRYLNLAAWINQFGANKWPREEQGHLRARLSAFAGAGVDAMLAAGGPASDVAERVVSLRNIIRQIAVPTLVSWTSIEGLRRSHNGGLLSKALMDRRLRELLS
jgi:hypothetical protein